MSAKIYVVTIAVFLLLTSSLALAGHHYHGHGSMMPSWDMNEMDANQDKTLSFEEYSDSQTKQLRAGFDMIDTNKDGVISEAEWEAFLNVHGVEVK